jgi:hypothetical protein
MLGSSDLLASLGYNCQPQLRVSILAAHLLRNESKFT